MIYLGLFGSMIALRAMTIGAEKLRDQLYVILLLLLFLFTAFRFEVGCDWGGYLNHWLIAENPRFLAAITMLEPGWWLIVSLVERSGLEYPWLNVAAAIPFFMGINALAMRQPDPLTFLIFTFPFLIVALPMSGIRQGMALGIICFAFLAFLDRRLLMFVALVLLASTIHNSAILFILLVPLVGGDYSRNRLIASAILAIPGLVIIGGSESAELATSRYIEGGIDAAGAAFRVVMVAIAAVVFLGFMRKEWRERFPHDYMLANLGSLAILGLVALLPISSVISDRMAYYFVPVQAAIFARAPYLNLRGFSRPIILLPYVMLLTAFAVWTTGSYLFSLCYVPYQSWLAGFPNTEFTWGWTRN